MDLTNRGAVITGANQGLGRMIATKFVKAGGSVFLVARGEKLLRQVEDELKPLAMERTVFRIQIEPAGWSETGADRVQFLVSPNAGEEPSSSPHVERCTDTATGITCPVVGSVAVVLLITGPCTVRSTWMVSFTGGLGSPGLVLPTCVSWSWMTTSVKGRFKTGHFWAPQNQPGYRSSVHAVILR